MTNLLLIFITIVCKHFTKFDFAANPKLQQSSAVRGEEIKSFPLLLLFINSAKFQTQDN